MNGRQSNTEKKTTSNMSETPKNQMEFQSSLPYPPINCEQKNRLYARMMLDNLAGHQSEMSAISLYLYNYFITDEHKELTNIFHQISIVEMHHLRILGTLAYQLGADPRLWAPVQNRAVYWSPSFNQYTKQIPQMIETAIREEQATIAKYTKQIQQIQDENIIENLKRIILDEEIHIQILENAKLNFS